MLIFKMDQNFINNFLNECKDTIANIDQNQIENVVRIVNKIRKKKGRIFFLGVGGSAGNASHAVNDFRKLANIECYAPTDNVSELTARTNDEGWHTTFENWLKVSRLNSSDLIFIFSVGGGSKKKKVSMNIVNAVNYAQKVGAGITGILGRDGGYTYIRSKNCILIPVSNSKHVTPISESFQALIWHLIISHPLIKKNQTKW
jgi:D-sedoheptulose 7-phosphate isomerase